MDEKTSEALGHIHTELTDIRIALLSIAAYLGDLAERPPEPVAMTEDKDGVLTILLSDGSLHCKGSYSRDWRELGPVPRTLADMFESPMIDEEED